MKANIDEGRLNRLLEAIQTYYPAMSRKSLDEAVEKLGIESVEGAARDSLTWLRKNGSEKSVGYKEHRGAKSLTITASNTFWGTGQKQATVDPGDVIPALAEALGVPDSLITVLTRRNTPETVVDILTQALELNGGQVQYNVEVKT